MSNSDDVVIRPGAPTGENSSNDRVSIGAGGTGIGLRRGGRSGITNKQAKRLLENNRRRENSRLKQLKPMPRLKLKGSGRAPLTDNQSKRLLKLTLERGLSWIKFTP